MPGVLPAMLREQTSRPLPVFFLSILVLLAAACAGGEVASSAIPTQPEASAPAQFLPASEPTTTPVPEDFGPGWIDLIRRGWLSIVDRHIDAPDGQQLLDAAWREASAEARGLGIAPPSAPPLDGGDSDEMWSAFADAYLALLDRTPAESWQALRFAALAGMTKSLNDCHTFFLPPARSEQLTDIRTGRASGGIGVELAPAKPAYFREVLTDSPAQQAGLRPGDILLAVDGRDVTQLGIEVISELLRGEPGTEVALEVSRPSTGFRWFVGLARALVRPLVVQGSLLEGGIGYVRIRSFTTGPSLLESLDKTIEDFEAAGAGAWVLDLRDNPGGDRNPALYARFLGNVTAERTLLRDGALETQESEGDSYAERPLAVLVNSGSASLAEILAAMLQDYGRARIFGAQTAKCAGFVSLETYPDGSTLGVTIAHSLTPLSERPLWQTGVVPDVTVLQTQDDLAAGRDPVLDAAVRWLRTQLR